MFYMLRLILPVRIRPVTLSCFPENRQIKSYLSNGIENKYIKAFSHARKQISDSSLDGTTGTGELP